MLLSEVRNIWGIGIDDLKLYNKKYMKTMMISYIIDAIVFTILLILMFYQNVDAGSYFVSCFIVCFSFTVYTSTLIDKDKAEACRFYRLHHKAKVVEAYYNVDEKKLFSVLYCSGCRRVKEGKDLSYYLELIMSQCLSDCGNCKSIMKYLSRYEVDSQEEGSLCLYIIRFNKAAYFVGVKEGD